MSKLPVFLEIIVCFLALTPSGVGQSATPPAGSVTPPILSFVLDNVGELRPLMGIPGSTFVGPALRINQRFTQAVVSAGNQYILAEAENGPVVLKTQGGSVYFQSMDFSNRSPMNCSATDLPSVPAPKRSPCADGITVAPPAIDQMIVSPTGSAAALYSQAEQRIYSFNNLAQSPVLLSTFDVGRFGALSTFGITDDGRTVALGISSNGSGSLFLLDPDQGSQLVGTMHHPSAMHFLANSNALVVADDVEDAIYMVAQGQIFPIANAEDGIAAPIAVATSQDNHTVFVGNSQTGAVTTLRLSDHSAKSTICHCVLTGLYPTGTDSVFRLTNYSGGPLVLFDAEAEPRIVFVRVGPQL